ncbi:hypothetical protein NL676_007112 [Syzygium grande]|nr:hypothetical protein NL676_007112 [Syzygium grande]
MNAKPRRSIESLYIHAVSALQSNERDVAAVAKGFAVNGGAVVHGAQGRARREADSVTRGDGRRLWAARTPLVGGRVGIGREGGGLDCGRSPWAAADLVAGGAIGAGAGG